MSKEKYNYILDKSEETIDFLNYLIETYGEVKAVKYGFEAEEIYFKNVYHDFIYYCITKSTKSLFAALELARKNLREDSLILLRTVYESYLHVSHTLSYPKKIQEYVFQVVGLSKGTYSYKKESNNRLNYKIVVNNKTLKEFRHGTTTIVMAKKGIRNIDYEIHESLYRYLSEHTHPNMMGSGNYRNAEDVHYTIVSRFIYLEVSFIILYLCFLILDVLYYYHTNINEWNGESLIMTDTTGFNSYKDSIKGELLVLIDTLDFSYLDENLKENIIKRIEIR